MRCEYCGAPAFHMDHVVPKSLVKKARRQGREIPAELTATVSACGPCNWLKMTRRLVPPSWENRLPLLAQTFPGVAWRVWRGDTQEAAFREVHR